MTGDKHNGMRCRVCSGAIRATDHATLCRTCSRSAGSPDESHRWRLRTSAARERD